MTISNLTPFCQQTQSGKTAIGTWVKLPTLEGVEILAQSGFDFIVVDMEHAPLTAKNAYATIVLGQALGMQVLVRIRDHGPGDIQRVLDSGASGILVPHVSSSVEAECVMRRMLFEPKGTRGIGTTSRAGEWGQLSPSAYVKNGNDLVARIPQIEDMSGAEHVEEILDTEGVNGIFVGPADLSASLGVPRDHPEVQKLSTRVLLAAKRQSVPCGTAVGTAADAIKMSEVGYSFVMVSNDASLLAGSARNVISTIRGASNR